MTSQTSAPVAPRAVASTPQGATARPRLWHAFACFLLDGREPVPGDVALCGHVKVSDLGSRSTAEAGRDACVVCLALRGVA